MTERLPASVTELENVHTGSPGNGMRNGTNPIADGDHLKHRLAERYWEAKESGAPDKADRAQSLEEASIVREKALMDYVREITERMIDADWIAPTRQSERWPDEQ